MHSILTFSNSGWAFWCLDTFPVPCCQSCMTIEQGMPITEIGFRRWLPSFVSPFHLLHGIAIASFWIAPILWVLLPVRLTLSDFGAPGWGICTHGNGLAENACKESVVLLAAWCMLYKAVWRSCPRGSVGMTSFLWRWQTADGGSTPRWSVNKIQDRRPFEGWRFHVVQDMLCGPSVFVMPPGSSTDATPTRELQAMSWSMERPIQARFVNMENQFLGTWDLPWRGMRVGKG